MTGHASETSPALPKEHAWDLSPARTMIFISHANPEDNVFTQWLALRLAREGYPVWCDLTKLLGGETFWRDIEKAIRGRTAKLLFVLSRHSNTKDGALDELDLALGVERSDALTDFVIPVRIDDLPFGDINVRLHRKNAIDFSRSWATGLGKLLEKFAEHCVPRDRRFAPQAITEWWHGSHSGSDLLTNKPDSHLSNWFPIESMPPGIYVHTLRADAKVPTAWGLPHPAHRIGDLIVSFAPRAEFGDLVTKTNHVALDYAIQSNDSTLPLTARQFRDCTVRLIRLAWDRTVSQRGLPGHELSRRRTASYFPKAARDGSRQPFSLPDGFRGSRGLFGYKTTWSSAERKKVRRYWHYAISAGARLFPHRVLILNGHIFFSSDGQTLWDSPKRLHSARRSLGSEWWNDDWRDRLLAAVSYIADRDEHIALPVASNQTVLVSSIPVFFEAATSYRDRFARHADPNEATLEDTEPAPEPEDETDGRGGIGDA